MSKQILNPRYCYKLTSDFIKRNKGIVKITNINTAIKQRYIVGLGDSTGTRMIRKLINSKYDEKYINDIKIKIFSDNILLYSKLYFADSDYDNANNVGNVVVGNRNVFALDLKDIFDYMGKVCITSDELMTMFWNSTTKVSKYSWLRSSYSD